MYYMLTHVLHACLLDHREPLSSSRLGYLGVASANPIWGCPAPRPPRRPKEAPQNWVLTLAVGMYDGADIRFLKHKPGLKMRSQLGASSQRPLTPQALIAEFMAKASASRRWEALAGELRDFVQKSVVKQDIPLTN